VQPVGGHIWNPYASSLSNPWAMVSSEPTVYGYGRGKEDRYQVLTPSRNAVEDGDAETSAGNGSPSPAGSRRQIAVISRPPVAPTALGSSAAGNLIGGDGGPAAVPGPGGPDAWSRFQADGWRRADGKIYVAGGGRLRQRDNHEDSALTVAPGSRTSMR